MQSQGYDEAVKDCIFCRIIRREAKGYIIYEDDDLLSFLDIHPVSPGHALVVPKVHFESVSNTPEEVLGKLIVTAKQIGKNQMAKLRADGFNIVSANGRAAQQSVFHIHFHVVPRFKGDGLNLWFHGNPGDVPVLDEVFMKLTAPVSPQ